MRRFTAFLLAPFAKWIRYGALKTMKRFSAPNDNRPIIAVADHLINDYILPRTFRLFNDEQFRTFASFKKLPRAEHDRIFNELMVASVSLLLASLEAAPRLVAPEAYHFWLRVEEQIPKQFARELMKFGVSSANAKLMRELIDMRAKEYRELSRQVQELNEGENKEFRELGDDMRHLAAIIQAIGIGTARHITRGKLPPRDPLIGFLIDWLFRFNRNLAAFVRKL